MQMCSIQNCKTSSLIYPVHMRKHREIIRLTLSLSQTYYFSVLTHVHWINQGDGFTISNGTHLQTWQNLQHFMEI